MVKIYTPLILSILLLITGCQNLETVNNNNPDRASVLSTGDDLLSVLRGGYVTWWQAVHSPVPAMALSVASDAYGLSWEDFGCRRMGEEPRKAYNNRTSEEASYQQIAKTPWYGCLSSASVANDVLQALEEGVTIDNGGPQDESIRAAAHFLRGVSWGYLGLIFDRTYLVDENTDLTQELELFPYWEVPAQAAQELEDAIALSQSADINFIHSFFNGLTMDAAMFTQLCHSYAARFLAQWPRTEGENLQVDWPAVLTHAEKGLTFNFAPLADGKVWTSYQQYAFAETGQGPFWARLDQRLVAALDPAQPARYPEVAAQGEAPLSNPQAQSNDARLSSDFLFLPSNNFPPDHGEWHFSHYKHNRNQTDPDFAGDGFSSGPMPAFLAADNELLKTEALLWLGRTPEAITALNAGTRVERGQLPPLSPVTNEENLKEAIFYERTIELLSTAPMSMWFDRRRNAPRQNFNEVTALGGLQTGTPAHLPIPAKELRIQDMEPYNFGGEQDPEGIVPIF